MNVRAVQRPVVRVLEYPEEPGDPVFKQAGRLGTSQQQQRGVRRRTVPEEPGLVKKRQVVPTLDFVPLPRMPLQELLPRLRQRRRLKGGKTCPVAELGRPVEFPCPDGPGPVRVLRQLGLAAADPYVGRSAEPHRLILGRSDLEDDDAALGVIHKVNIESRVRLESRPKPRKEVLVSLGYGRVRVEGRPCDSVGYVLNAEHEVALRLLH